MIQSFADKYAEAFYNGEFVRKSGGISVQAERRMNVLDAAMTLELCFQATGSNLLRAIGKASVASE